MSNLHDSAFTSYGRPVEMVPARGVERSANNLLAALPSEDYQRIAPYLRSVPMKLKQIVYRQGEPITNVYFPEGGAYALVKTLADGKVAEVGSIGSEGVVGAGVFFGQRMADCDVLVQLAGSGAQLIPTEVFNLEMERRGALYNRVVRYTQALLSQVMQSTACNSLHSAEQRCCRWLLMTCDRAGTHQFVMTQEFLASMLGLRRPTVTIVAQHLQQMGLIEYKRKTVTILDRDRLEAEACECYHVVRDQMKRLLPEVHAPAILKSLNSAG